MMKTSLFALSLLTLTQALALAGTSGKTADGCTYQIVNGQYLTSCAKPKAAQDAVMVASAAPAAATPPPSSYSSVPVRYEPSAPRPSVQTVAPETMSIAITPPPGAPARSIERYEDDGWERRRNREKQEILDSTYAGVQLGSTSISQSNAGATLGMGLNVGTNIDDNFGVELGYAYSNQDVNLNLATRGSSDPTLVSNPAFAQRSTDASLRSHVISAEVQGHITDSYKRLRPYLGLGLAWKNSSVDEDSQSNGMGGSIGGGSLTQNSLGGIGSAGTKFRISGSFNFNLAFRYFFPISRGKAQLSQPEASPYGAYGTGYTVNQTRLTQADSALTGSSQSQIFAGLQYAF